MVYGFMFPPVNRDCPGLEALAARCTAYTVIVTFPSLFPTLHSPGDIGITSLGLHSSMEID